MRTTLLFSLLLASFSFLWSQPLSQSYLLLGPFPLEEGVEAPTEAQQKAAFAKDLVKPTHLSGVKEGLGLMHMGKSMVWQKADTRDGYLDADAFYSEPDFVYAYAYTEIEMPEAGKRLVGIGSDDAIKIWLNGELVHSNYTFRPHQTNEDLVEFNFVKGKNTLLIRIQDNVLDWGFSLHFPTVDQFPAILEKVAGSGQMEMAEMLLNYRANPNAAGPSGLTPWQAARIKGRTDMCELLEKRGAKPNLPFPAMETLVDQLFQDLREGKKPGAAVLVARDGKVLYEGGFGYADVEGSVTVTPETKFRIGSISKQFTAAAILKLVENGKMNLQDPLIKYIPDFPGGKDVTIRHLLTHTSGIHSYTGDPLFIERVTKPIKWEDLLEEIKQYDYDFEPGANWAYNNSGYMILGYLVEKISGMTFQAFLKKEFFSPLGMKNTGVYVNGKKYKNEALGYEAGGEVVQRSIDWDMSWAGGAGNLYSTVKDLYLWNEGIFNGKVLKEETLREAHTPATLDDGTMPNALGGSGYGFGWAIGEYRGASEISHSGGLHGFITNLSRLPGENLTVAVLTNCMPPIGKGPGEYTQDLIELFAWDGLEEQASFSVKKDADYSQFDDYTGQYEYPGGAIMTITREGDHLYAKLATQPVSEIFPQSSTRFFWKDVDAQIEFVRDANGLVTHAMHTQSGQTFKAPRTEADTEVKIDLALYDRYAGEYLLGPVVITIFRKGDQLFAQVTGQEALEIFPKSETEFFLKVVKAYLIFESDASGTVTGLILDQGGVKQKAARK